MPFEKPRLPDPPAYCVAEDLQPIGSGKWRPMRCVFHGGTTTLRMNMESGAWICMSCGAKGGDVLSFHMQRHGLDFVSAAKALGAWVDNGRSNSRQSPLSFSARAGLEVISFECLLVATAACNIAKGLELATNDRDRLVEAASRIQFIAAEVVR